nr:hypothetical protein [Tanacetum cinerariifolium]
QPAPTSAPAKPQGKKHKQATKASDKPPKGKKSKYGVIGKKHSLKSVAASEAEDVPVMEPQVAAKDIDLQKDLEESIKTAHALPRGPLLPVSDNEEESKKFVLGADEGGQGEGQDGPDPGAQAESQMGSNASDQDEGQAGSNPSEISEGQAGPDPGNAGADVHNIPNEGFTITTYLRVQDNLKPTVEEHVLLEDHASSSGTLSSLQHLSKDISFRDLFFSDKPTDADKNADTEVESMVRKAVSEVVTDAVDWAMQAPLQNHFRDLPEADMKEILHQRMWETESYKSHEDHMQLFEALEKSMNRDHSEELAQDLAKARKKKKKSLLPPPPPPSSTNQESPSKGSTAPSSSKTAASAEYQAWTMTDVRLRMSISLNLINLEMDANMAPDEQAQSSNDEDIGSAHIPKTRFLCRPVISPHSWTGSARDEALLSSNLKTWKASHLKSLKHNVSKPLPLGGPPGQVTIQSDFFFSKDLEYMRYGNKGRRPALSISKMKGAYYPDVGLEQMVPNQFWIEEEAVMTHMRILSVVRVKVFSKYKYDYMKKIVLRRVDLNEHVITERDFKYLYPSDFEDLYMLNLQGHLNHLPPKDKKILTTVVNQWTKHLEIDEALDYGFKEFRINRINPGLNIRFWTRKDVDRCKEFMFAIQRRLRTRRIFRNLDSFVGGRVREGDYRLLKRLRKKYRLSLKNDMPPRDNGSDHEDANEHIEKVLEIIDLFHILNINQDQVMLRAFPMSLIGATSHWIRNIPSGLITTWEDLKTKFLSKYYPPARTAKIMEEINNFQQEPDKTLYHVWERFKELLMKFSQHYLKEMQEPSKKMAEYSQKWHNGTSRTRSIETFNELEAIQAQLNNLGREIKKVNPLKKPTTLNLVDLSKEGDIEQQLQDSTTGTMQTLRTKNEGDSISIMPLSPHLNLGLGELAHTNLTVELADKTLKYSKGIAKNVLVGIGKFVFPVDFKILDMLEDVKVPLILEIPFLSTTYAKIDVYMLSLKKGMELDLEARLMGETLVLNRLLDPLYGDYIELNDLNVPLELRRDQVDDLMPTVKECEVIDESMIDIIKTRNNESFDEYLSFYDFDRKIHNDCAYNLIFSCMIVVENMDGYRDQDMGDIILGEPFCKALCMKARSFDGLITIHNGSDNVTYQMDRSHSRFKHLSNA